MDIKTQVEILCDHSSNSITKHPNQIRREILAAMTAWERQQTQVLRERVAELEAQNKELAWSYSQLLKHSSDEQHPF